MNKPANSFWKLWKKNLCRKPENAIYKSRKPIWREKKQIEICGNQKSLFGSRGKLQKPKKQGKVAETGKSEKKPWKAGKGRCFLRKPGNRLPITPPLHTAYLGKLQSPGCIKPHADLYGINEFEDPQIHVGSLFIAACSVFLGPMKLT